MLRLVIVGLLLACLSGCGRTRTVVRLVRLPRPPRPTFPPNRAAAITVGSCLFTRVLVTPATDSDRAALLAFEEALVYVVDARERDALLTELLAYLRALEAAPVWEEGPASLER